MTDTINHSSVIFVSPNSYDSDLAGQLLREAGIQSTAYKYLNELTAKDATKIGCIIVVEEAIANGETDHLLKMLAEQPAWSDLPLILIASQQTPLQNLVERIFHDSGNVTLLERPLNPATLVSAVRVALRARARQFQVRTLLTQRDDAIQRQNEFLAMLAHELRNPLAPIRNGVHIMKLLDLPDDRFERARSMIERQVKHLSKLVDDLLEIARLERGKIELKTQVLDLNFLVNDVVESFCQQVRARNQSLQFDRFNESVYVNCDPTRIEQILTNLLANASKYTNAGGNIRVKILASHDTATLLVSDNGIGIPRDKLDTIFDLFSQAKRSLDRSEGGLGIGLTVVKRLVELHHGTVRAESSGLDQGTTIVVSLPRVESPGVRRSEVNMNSEQRKRSILIVEDNADIRESVELLLKFWGHDVTLCDEGCAGLQKLVELCPDVALIDIGLPGMNGYEIAKSARARVSVPILLVAMSGYGHPQDVKHALDSGFDLHLLKPVEPDRLAEVLTSAHLLVSKRRLNLS